jgi:hypothetical protein
LVPVALFGGLFVRDLMFLLSIRKWPIYHVLSSESVGGYPQAITDKGVERLSRTEADSFKQKYDTTGLILRMAKRNFETNLIALAVSAIVALLDFASP